MVLLAIGSGIPVRAQQQAPRKRLIIRAGRLIDGKSGTPLIKPTILIEGERIAAVGQNVPVLEAAQMSTARRALRGAALGRQDLEAGITIVRDLGNSGRDGDVALRDAIQQGWVTGPRMVVSTRALAPPGGQFGVLTPQAQSLIEQEYAVISGAEEPGARCGMTCQSNRRASGIEHS